MVLPLAVVVVERVVNKALDKVNKLQRARIFFRCDFGSFSLLLLFIRAAIIIRIFKIVVERMELKAIPCALLFMPTRRSYSWHTSP